MNSNPNDLLERYLQAVGQYLPSSTREDMLAELRANLLEQMDARAEELSRPLTDADVASILLAHGRPEAVAVRYLPQRSLIGLGLFPTYLLTLRKAAPFVVFIYAIVRGITFIASTSGPISGPVVVENIVEGVLQLIPTLLIFWSVVTIVFAALEFSQGHFAEAKNWPGGCAWDPRKLPPVKTEQGAVKRRSLTSRVADLVVHCVWMAYCFALPSHPYLLIGPGLHYLETHHVRFAPAWTTYFLLLAAVLLMQFAVKVDAVLSEDGSRYESLKLMVDLFALAAAGYMAFAGDYFVATSAAADLHTLASVNHAMGLAFRVGAFFAILGLIADSWKSIKRHIPTERFAF